MMQYKINKNKIISNNKNSYINNYTPKTTQKKINILIRTSNRPNCFSLNIDSIIKQNYHNLNLFISYDNDLTKEYIINKLDHKNLNSLGFDLVAMCVNDLIVQGAKPLFFLDYIAVGKLNLKKTKDILAGIFKGCELSDCK